MILTGGPEHLYTDQVPAPGPWQTGHDAAMAGNEPVPPALYDRADRAAYYQGHIRGTLARKKAGRAGTFTPATGVSA